MENEELINILLIEVDTTTSDALMAILRDSSNNFICVKSAQEAFQTIEHVEVGIILINLDLPNFDESKFLDRLRSMKNGEKSYPIVYSNDFKSASKFVKGLREGAVDYFNKPFNPNLIKAKVNVYKSFYFKDRKIDQLLTNILPEKVIESYERLGFYTPKKIEKGVVMFTDFVNFSERSSKMKPIDLLRELDLYFTRFDEIMERYQLEKIKTIGDAYMALAGVNHDFPHPVVRASLAAMEIRDFVINRKKSALALGKDFWEIRIGIHVGPLVSGVIGQKKIAFDVWGDTVNIASRAEQSSLPNEVNITLPVAQLVKKYVTLESRGHKEIAKRGGAFELFFVRNIKPEYSLMGEGVFPNSVLRKSLGLSSMDFDNARKEILDKLKAGLPDELYYHNYEHILKVEQSAITLSRMEGIKGLELILLRTAVIFHDSGYLLADDENEAYSIALAKSILPKYDYSKAEIAQVENMIQATKHNIRPSNLIEAIICDANLDYLGRADYYEVAKNLRKELAAKGTKFKEKEWLEFQLHFLEKIHTYYTNTSKNTREHEKKNRIKELRLALSK